MYKVRKELGVLEKSFPFIKFTFSQEDALMNVKILLNDQNKNSYNVWYDPYNEKWYIQHFNKYNLFNEFLNQFIEGLIYKNIY